jgi:hypothetical protein
MIVTSPDRIKTMVKVLAYRQLLRIKTIIGQNSQLKKIVTIIHIIEVVKNY